MFRSLRLRLLFALSSIVILAMAALGYFASRATTSELQQYLERDFLDYERFVNPFILFKIQNFMEFRRVDCDQSLENWLECQSESISYSNENLEELQTLVEGMAILAGTRIIVTDQNRLVLANSNPAENLVRMPSNKKVSGVAVVDGEPFLVYIELTADTEIGARQQLFLGEVNRALVTSALSAALAALITAFLLSRIMLRPIEALTQATRKLGKGDMTHRVRASSKDEIGELSQAFNTMADNLSRLEQLRRNLVSDVAHELRTPLSSLRGYLEAIQDGLLEPKPAIVNSLHEEVMLLSRLVDDLQELALAEAGQIQLKSQPVDMGMMVEKALHSLQPITEKKGISISVSIPDKLPALDADPARLKQILSNLLNNAVLYTPENGSIEVKAWAINEDIIVSVKDSGVGIAPEHLSFVFERFYRVDESRTRATGGAGLGLAIVKQLVQAHGGEVNVSSKLGEGTTFTLRLPQL